MATIGQTLSAARIAAGCSLENLSTRTRIRMQVLRGIENEDFVPCGGDFYARGHIRRICKLLGLDPEPLLEEYDREHASTEKPTFVPPPRHPSARTKASRVAAAQGGQAHTGATDQGAPRGVPRSIGDEDADPEQRAESWGHFERNQKLARPPRRNRPRGAPAAAAAASVPGPRRPGRHSRPEDGGADDGAQKGAPGAPAGEGAVDRTAATATAAGAGATRTAARPVVTRTSTRRAESVRRHWPWAVVGLILVAAVFVGVRTWQGWDDDNPVRTAFESARSNGGETVDSAVLPKEGVSGPDQRAEAAEVAETAEADGAEEAAGEFTVALTASDRSWVKVTDTGGEALFTGFLLEGETQDYVTEEPLTLWVGNAGAVGVAVDGQDQGPAGNSGEVKEISVGADGFDD
ncbi:helix-turn-helix domain-containing protein [Nocardiopsis ganjiahuensis]|uniref:helix-turn-helix domain-containing protein n=1 Tax=Nocardiopsis ganjiahuensis TaxID=239984 RepID=UPI000344E381